MYSTKNFTPRDYQLKILNSCKNKNSLICLPTGTGKTKLAILIALNRLNEFPNSKIFFLTPTKPLASQIFEEFKEATNISKEKIILVTGAISPEKRIGIYENAVVVIATPQTIEKDIGKKRIDLNNFSLLIIDECHRSRQNFANTKVAKSYITDSKFSQIIALTASPGSDKEKINEICKNLYLSNIEIMTEEDNELKKHIQEKNIENILVDFPESFKGAHTLINGEYRLKLGGLKSFGLYKPISVISKTDLVNAQKRFIGEVRKKNHSAFYGMSLVSQLLKLSYCLEILETQSLKALHEFFKKLDKDESKAAKNIISNESIKEARSIIGRLIDNDIKHPKMIKLNEILIKEISENKNYRAIVFANYRITIDEIVDNLSKNNIKAKKFVGQANKSSKGLNQKEQASVINNFKNLEFNVLVASSVAEEGIDIPEVNAVIFYEPIGSELRKIQRSGRTGRTTPGKIIFLITRETRDVGIFYSSLRKEKKMKSMLNKMKESNVFSKYEV